MSKVLLNKICFAVRNSNPKDVAYVVYLVEGVVEGTDTFYAVICDVFFSDEAELTYRDATLAEAPRKILYKNNVMPNEFNSWIKVGCKIADVSQFDVSFLRFWNVYGHKVGNKSLVEKKWGKMKWEDRVMAILAIGRIRNYYNAKGLEMPYPQTYIDQRRWENEF